VIVVFPYLPGSDSPFFRGISIFIGVLFSLGSSSAISNIVAGVVLTYMRPFKEGDVVKITDTIGKVIEKKLLVTRIRTIKNVHITIPNSMVLSSHITNYSSSSAENNLILHTTITVSYDVSWTKVHELLKSAAKQTDLVLNTAEPFVLQKALDAYYVSYELNVYTQTPTKMANIYSDLHRNILDVFNAAGIELLSPQYNSIRDGNQITIPKPQSE
jgi:small-conductance mechanosensitive channel